MHLGLAATSRAEKKSGSAPGSSIASNRVTGLAQTRRLQRPPWPTHPPGAGPSPATRLSSRSRRPRSRHQRPPTRAAADRKCGSRELAAHHRLLTVERAVRPSTGNRNLAEPAADDGPHRSAILVFHAHKHVNLRERFKLRHREFQVDLIVLDQRFQHGQLVPVF